MHHVECYVQHNFFIYLFGHFEYASADQIQSQDIQPYDDCHLVIEEEAGNDINLIYQKLQVSSIFLLFQYIIVLLHIYSSIREVNLCRVHEIMFHYFQLGVGSPDDLKAVLNSKEEIKQSKTAKQAR